MSIVLFNCEILQHLFVCYRERVKSPATSTVTVYLVSAGQFQGICSFSSSTVGNALAADIDHINPVCSLAQYSLISAKSWPKTPIIQQRRMALSSKQQTLAGVDCIWTAQHYQNLSCRENIEKANTIEFCCIWSKMDVHTFIIYETLYNKILFPNRMRLVCYWNHRLQ
jgi:hypothetical protein